MMKFQVERIALFSDAVFAIAITLMMIEVHPPHITHDMTFGQVLGALAGMSGTFIATLLSFILIGLNWMLQRAPAVDKHDVFVLYCHYPFFNRLCI
jgi:uncharacterized membrane protein